MYKCNAMRFCYHAYALVDTNKGIEQYRCGDTDKDTDTDQSVIDHNVHPQVTQAPKLEKQK